MDRIVIVTDSSEENDMLITCLRMLFPECEIQIVSSRTESPGDVPEALGHDAVDKGGEKNGKYLNCR